MEKVETLKVSGKSKPRAIAGAIAGFIKENKQLEIQIIGAGALNQAMKGIIIARGYLILLGIDLSLTPTFMNMKINGESKIGMKLILREEKVNGSK